MTPERAKQLLPLIQALAAGKQIQFRLAAVPDDRWTDCPDPSWLPDAEYRIKPDLVKVKPYRRYLWRDVKGEFRVALVGESIEVAKMVEGHSYFLKWLDDDWVELTHDCESA